MKNLCALLVLFGVSATAASFTNGGFEGGVEGWRIWSREQGAASLEVDQAVRHSGNHSGKLQHTGTQDWSLEPQQRLTTKAGDFYEMEAWVKVEGGGTITLCASTWDAAGKAVEWSYGSRTANASPGVAVLAFTPARSRRH